MYFLRKIKAYLIQTYLREKFRVRSKLAKGVKFSVKTHMEAGCSIGSYSILGNEVKLGEKVEIGSGVCLEQIEIGKFSRIDSRVICTGSKGGKIIIGENSYIGLYNVLDHSDNISIGDFVHIAGPSTGLWTHSSYLMCLNSVKLIEQTVQNRPTAPIRIENNVYIGGNCTIYPGITIGHHSIVAPNSAVTKDVPPYTMVGGVPAAFIKHTYDMINGNTADDA